MPRDSSTANLGGGDSGIQAFIYTRGCKWVESSSHGSSEHHFAHQDLVHYSGKEQHMPYARINGVNLYYKEYRSGPTVILTPGGRVDHNGLRPIAALLFPHCRVILHDRRNCGRSDVVIGGELSEQHLWAEEMAGPLVEIGAAPAYAAGGSAGSRTSLALAVRHPEVVKGVFIWEVSGGPRSGELMAPGYYGQYIEAAERGGMAAVAETEFFAQRIRDNPSNRERLWPWTCRNFAL